MLVSMFDVGVAGPIAGFIASLIILFWGFTHVPGKEYILSIHPDYFANNFGKGQLELAFGNTFLFSILKSIFVDNTHFFPPMSETDERDLSLPLFVCWLVRIICNSDEYDSRWTIRRGTY